MATKITSIRLDDEIMEGLRLVQERDGVPQSEQIRRALRAWLVQRGVLEEASKKTARKRVQPRRRA
jgi:Arc/MetJ-type ribon-helix-helix transcriptional regulator